MPDAAIINFIIVEEAVGGQEADLGISITDWKDASKPPGVRLSEHITSFPFLIKSRVESGPRNFTPNITVSDMVQGTTNPKVITSKDRTPYLEGMKFNLEDTTGSLTKMTRKYGLWMYHPHAAINPKQVEYQKSMSGMELPSWNGNMSDLMRNCLLIQDKFSDRECLSEDDWGTKQLTTNQAKLTLTSILRVIQASVNTKLKGEITTYVQSQNDVWCINAADGVSLNKFYVILYHSYFSDTKLSRLAAEKLAIKWYSTQTAYEFIQTQEVELEGQNFESAKQTIRINLKDNLSVEDWERIQREIDNPQSVWMQKNTIQTWGQYLREHVLGSRIAQARGSTKAATVSATPDKQVKESWKDKNRKLKEQPPGKGSGKEKSTPGNAADLRPVGKCYKCNEPGHISINCTNKGAWKCHNCNEKGHVAKDCTAEKKGPAKAGGT